MKYTVTMTDNQLSQNERKALDIALQILGECYGYPEDPPEEGDDK